MDPLSDVLSLLKTRTYMSGGFDMGGEWSIRFGPHEGIKCYALVSGQCWLSVEGVPDAVRLKAGDCFLLPSGRPFRLASDLRLPPVDAHTIFQFPLNGGIASYDPISAIALALGYESESAFSTAFKRVMGCSPRQYSRGRNPASPSHSEGEAARANRLEPVAAG